MKFSSTASTLAVGQQVVTATMLVVLLVLLVPIVVGFTIPLVKHPRRVGTAPTTTTTSVPVGGIQSKSSNIFLLYGAKSSEEDLELTRKIIQDFMDSNDNTSTTKQPEEVAAATTTTSSTEPVSTPAKEG